MKSVTRILILASVCVGLLAPSYAMGQLFFFSHPLQGKKAPDFTLSTLSGQKVNMTSYRGHQPALIFFWATWCPHCRTQLKDLYASQDSLKQKGLKVIVVNLQENPGNVRVYLQQNRMDMEMFFDEDASVADRYEIVGIPTFFLVDRDGTVVAVENSFPGNFEALLRESAGSEQLPYASSGMETAGVDQ